MFIIACPVFIEEFLIFVIANTLIQPKALHVILLFHGMVSELLSLIIFHHISGVFSMYKQCLEFMLETSKMMCQDFSGRTW